MDPRSRLQVWGRAVAVGLLLALPSLAAAQAPASRSAPDPLCVVSADAAYARSQEHPAEVGGGAMYAAAR